MKESKVLSFGSLGFVATFLVALLWIGVSSCESKPPKNSLWAQGERGKVHFQKYCVSCHGEDGKGLLIDSLFTQPADLTRILASNKKNEFPILYVANKIDGRKMAKAHGSRTMPIWGEVFSEEELLDESQIKGKLGELVAYLISIQQ
jgi:mono/diheme cytochrome c family protein